MVTRTIYCFLDCPALHSRPAAFRFATHQNRWSRLCLWQRRMADGEGFEPPDGLPHQRFSRPSHSTALPTILNFFVATGLSNRRFWSAPNFIWLDLASQSRPSHSTAAFNHPKPVCALLHRATQFILSSPQMSNFIFCGSTQVNRNSARY